MLCFLSVPEYPCLLLAAAPAGPPRAVRLKQQLHLTMQQRRKRQALAGGVPGVKALLLLPS
jgi:hypothetical protein